MDGWKETALGNGLLTIVRTLGIGDRQEASECISFSEPHFTLLCGVDVRGALFAAELRRHAFWLLASDTISGDTHVTLTLRGQTC